MKNRVELIKTLIGEDTSELVADILEEDINIIIEYMEKAGDEGIVPVFSYDLDEEREQLDELYHAFMKVLSWYKV